MKISKGIFLLILAITIFGLYSPAWKYQFIWDDKVLFEDNPLFTENQPLSSALTTSYFRQQVGLHSVDFYYRPVLMLSFWLENKLWGIHPFALRLVNLIIFFCGLAAWYFFFKARYDIGSFPEIVVILFALFPFHVDNIVWVVGRGDLLVILFSGLCFLSLDRYVRQKRPKFLFWAWLFFTLGLFSKEAVMFFWPVFVVAEYSFRKKINLFFHGGNSLSIVAYFLIKGPLLHIRNIPYAWPQHIISSGIIGAIGYYARAVVFPFTGPRFVTQTELASLPLIMGGAFALLALILVVLLPRKRQPALLPASLLFVFLGGHSLLAFSRLFPYRAYARYTVIPALAFFWLVAQEVCRLKEKPRSAVTSVILILFIPRVVSLTRDYRHEIIFWQRAAEANSADTYARFQLASAFFQQKDYIDAELVLNQTLFMKMPREVALLISLLYSDLELTRANYDNVFRWLNSIESLVQQPGYQLVGYMQFYLRGKRAAALISLGRFNEAEKLLGENKNIYPKVKETYRELYSLYLGQEKWAEAAALELVMKQLFPGSFNSLSTKMIEDHFLNYGPEQKISFYEFHRNYPRAIELLEGQGDVASLPEEKIGLLARLYLKNGQPERARELVNLWSERNKPAASFFNKIGFVYLNEFCRVREAFDYFQKSLELDKNQMEIRYIIMRLTETYLKRLKPVWPEEKKIGLPD